VLVIVKFKEVITLVIPLLENANFALISLVIVHYVQHNLNVNNVQIQLT